MATDASGVSYAFGRGADDAVWFCRKPGTGFTLPQSLGGNVDSDPWAVSDATGLYVFARGIDRAIWYRRFVNGNPGPWTSLGGTLTVRPHGVRHAERADRRRPRHRQPRCGCATSSGRNGITTWQWIDGFVDVGSRDLQRPGRHVRVRARHRSRDLVQPVQRRYVVAPFARLGALACRVRSRSATPHGVSVLFVGSDKALRTFRFANGSWGPEQFIRGGFAPVRGGG